MKKETQTSPLGNHSTRAHALLSASSAHRWLVCPYSATVSERYPSQDTIFTREGTTAHEVAEAVASGASNPKNIETGHDVMGNENGITDEMVRHAEEYRDYIKSLSPINTSMLLERKVDFSDYVPNGFGTADCILLHGNTMDVIDYKYGQGVAVEAKGNPQMMLYGLGAVAEYGFIYDVEIVRLHIFQPRINNISVYETTMEQLLAWGEVVVRPAAEKAAAGLVEMHGGEHCRFCPHAGKCPELSRYCQDRENIGKAPDTLTPEEIAQILEQAPVIELWLKKVKDTALNSALDGQSVPGYKVVEGRVGNRKWKDELEVAKALNEAGIAQEDYTTLKLLSPAEMDKSIGKKKVAELLFELIDRAPGSPTLVPESDKRPAYNRKADIIKDFE